jgi:hypothetical protein
MSPIPSRTSPRSCSVPPSFQITCIKTNSRPQHRTGTNTPAKQPPSTTPTTQTPWRHPPPFGEGGPSPLRMPQPCPPPRTPTLPLRVVGREGPVCSSCCGSSGQAILSATSITGSEMRCSMMDSFLGLYPALSSPRQAGTILLLLLYLLQTPLLPNLHLHQSLQQPHPLAELGTSQ